jgi:rubredoxin
MTQTTWIDNFCPKCGVSKYNFFTVIKGANGERTKPFGTWNYCPACGADLRGKKVEGDAE